MRVQWVHGDSLQFQMATPPTNRQAIFGRDGSSRGQARPCQAVEMLGNAILIASNFIFSFFFCDRNHTPWAHAYWVGPSHLAGGISRGEEGLIASDWMVDGCLNAIFWSRVEWTCIETVIHTSRGSKTQILAQLL